MQHAQPSVPPARCISLPSQAEKQQQSKCIQNDQNNAFHTVPPLGGRGEDKEVSHVAYCCIGKWLMVENVTDERDWKT